MGCVPFSPFCMETGGMETLEVDFFFFSPFHSAEKSYAFCLVAPAAICIFSSFVLHIHAFRFPFLSTALLC